MELTVIAPLIGYREFLFLSLSMPKRIGMAGERESTHVKHHS